ncbi:MAG: Gfo/Idh/MocA family oxidoreductase [Rhodospirillales bacterium]|nr:Gfo/Idh/MocA family oxidoreductase [Rhodospirillales bacterium]
MTAVVVGCGAMGAFTRPGTRSALPPGWLPLAHAEAVVATPGLVLIGVCDSDAAVCERASAHYGVPAFADHRAMLAELRPAIACVATRTEPRVRTLVDCAKAGVRGMHAEKPLSRSMEDARCVAAALVQAGASFTYGALRRYHATYLRAAALVADGAIGDLRQIVVGFGRRTAMWTHAHSLDAMLFFAGAPVRIVQARIAVDPGSVCETDGIPTIDADPTIETGYVAFENGVSGQITQLDGFDILLAGSSGTLRIAADGTRIDLDRTGPSTGGYFTATTSEPALSSQPGGTALALGRLCGFVASGKPDQTALDAAVDGQRALFAMLLSGLRGGIEVAPGDVPDTMTVTGRSGNLFA